MKSIVTIGAILGGIFALGIGYMLFAVSPEEVTERVEVMGMQGSDCIVETMDGYSFNIGPCDAEVGDIILAKIDAKVKERQYAMNPDR